LLDPGKESNMSELTVDEVMDDMEQRAEDRLQLLHVLENAKMMQVTRQAICAWIEEQQTIERQTFGALSAGAAH
jgi:hypothetical protein